MWLATPMAINQHKKFSWGQTESIPTYPEAGVVGGEPGCSWSSADPVETMPRYAGRHTACMNWPVRRWSRPAATPTVAGGTDNAACHQRWRPATRMPGRTTDVTNEHPCRAGFGSCCRAGSGSDSSCHRRGFARWRTPAARRNPRRVGPGHQPRGRHTAAGFWVR